MISRAITRLNLGILSVQLEELISQTGGRYDTGSEIGNGVVLTTRNKYENLVFWKFVLILGLENRYF